MTTREAGANLEGGYVSAIRQSLEKQGDADVNPRYVEAWMRSEIGTLDALGDREFDRAVADAVDCVRSTTEAESISLAESYGLVP